MLYQSSSMLFRTICGINGAYCFYPLPRDHSIYMSIYVSIYIYIYICIHTYMYKYSPCCMPRCQCGQYIEMCIDCRIGQKQFRGTVFHYTQVTYFDRQNDDLFPSQRIIDYPNVHVPLNMKTAIYSASKCTTQFIRFSSTYNQQLIQERSFLSVTDCREAQQFAKAPTLPRTCIIPNHLKAFRCP